MINIPYILDYKLFEQIDYKVADELLAEYNDFMVFNRTQVRDLGVPASDAFQQVAAAEENTEEIIKRAEHNKQAALAHFESLFGNKDIAESALVGMKIDYDTVQKILLEERLAKVPITASAFNQIAPTIRAAASVLLIAEHVVTAMQKLAQEKMQNEKIQLAIEFAKEGFELLLDDVSKGSLQIPEYHAVRKELGKMKTVDSYIGFCEKLFFANRDS
jgi:hypothetical protein